MIFFARFSDFFADRVRSISRFPRAPIKNAEKSFPSLEKKSPLCIKGGAAES